MRRAAISFTSGDDYAAELAMRAIKEGADLIGFLYHMRSNHAHPMVLRAIYERVGQDDRKYNVYIAGHPNTPGDVLEKLAESPTQSIRLQVVLNSAVSNDLLAVLCEDLDPYVADTALKKLNWRLS
jgi:hypothetical protein